MAEVDLSNAVLQPYNKHPANSTSYLGLRNARITDSSGASITSGVSSTIVTNTSNQLNVLFTATFNTSGTEFYIYDYQNGGPIHWKVSNVSFASGDTITFQINADLVTT